MKENKKLIIEKENIHKIEPFFIKYLTIISSIIFILLFIFLFGKNRLNEEYNIINIWNKSNYNYEMPSHDNNFNIEGEFNHNFFTKSESMIHYFNKDGITTFYTNLQRGELASLNNEIFIIYKRYGNYIDAYNNNGLIWWIVSNT